MVKVTIADGKGVKRSREVNEMDVKSKTIR